MPWPVIVRPDVGEADMAGLDPAALDPVGVDVAGVVLAEVRVQPAATAAGTSSRTKTTRRMSSTLAVLIRTRTRRALPRPARRKQRAAICVPVAGEAE